MPLHLLHLCLLQPLLPLWNGAMMLTSFRQSGPCRHNPPLTRPHKLPPHQASEGNRHCTVWRTVQVWMLYGLREGEGLHMAMLIMSNGSERSVVQAFIPLGGQRCQMEGWRSWFGASRRVKCMEK